MKRTLKKYFIPHEGNDHKPHILREGATTFMLAGILCLEAAFLVGALFLYPRLDFLAAILPSVLVEETNLSRQTENLAPLKTNSLLELAAEAKANDMAQKSYFSHITPDGRTPWSFLQDVKYSFVAAGENLAVNFFDSKDVAQAWMDSPGHRANIMNKNFKEIGIATAHGFYQGRDAIFVVQFFGTPAKAAAPPLAPEKLKVTPKVAEASSQSNVKEETFVAVQNESAEEEISLSPVPAASDGTSLSSIVSTPRATTNYIYGALAAVILAALTLKIFVKIKIQHPVLIANGVLVLLVLVTAALANEYLSLIYTQVL